MEVDRGAVARPRDRASPRAGRPARASAKKRSYSARPSPRCRRFGFVAIRWQYATLAWSGDRNPTRKPASRPSSVSASHDVPVKCWSHSRGSRWSIFRPPHQSSMTRTDRGVVRLGRAAEAMIARRGPRRRHQRWTGPGAGAPRRADRRRGRARRGRTARTSSSR